MPLLYDLHMATAFPTESLIGCLVAATLAALFGLLLRACGVRRAWIFSGVCIGSLLGVQGLGRFHSAWYEQFFMGAGSQHREVFIAERSLELAESTALVHRATVDPSDQAVLEAEIHAANNRLHQARAAFDLPAEWLVACMAACAVIGCSPLIGRNIWWSHGGLAIGVWSVAASASAVAITLSMTENPSNQAWWLVAISFVCLGAPPMRARDHWLAVRLLGSPAATLDGARGTAGMISLLLVLLVAVSRGGDHPAWLLPWGALVAAWGLVGMPPQSFLRWTGPAIAACVAIAMSRLDPISDWKPLVAFGFFLAAEDMRWLGASAGLAIWGRCPWRASVRSTMPLADASSAQAALAAAAGMSGVIPAWMVWSLLASAATVALFEPLRRTTALRLDQSNRPSPGT